MSKLVDNSKYLSSIDLEALKEDIRIMKLRISVIKDIVNKYETKLKNGEISRKEFENIISSYLEESKNLENILNEKEKILKLHRIVELRSTLFNSLLNIIGLIDTSIRKLSQELGINVEFSSHSLPPDLLKNLDNMENTDFEELEAIRRELEDLLMERDRDEYSES
ncbi:hypothetical protein B6U74_00215 [Candidatus Bathyarchaeota archaeon ex4484_205]|nr:MAG: hypothetical protein B6U74_00215 [Candidatus Bathyarchaeota archaeon ex4484_205]RLG69162.1 MAG: hypothetical protein DRN93_00865 [archaeon]